MTNYIKYIKFFQHQQTQFIINIQFPYNQKYLKPQFSLHKYNFSQSFNAYYNINLIPIKLMLGTQTHFTRRKKSTDNIITHKSPYFASVRRNIHHNKIKGSAQNALCITKYPSTAAYAQQDPQGSIHKKKVFKRFGKFQQIDQVYTTDLLDPKIHKKFSTRQNTSPVHQNSQKVQKSRSNPKDFLYSSKTLALAEKYSSYKSIIMSTPKFAKDKQRIRKHNFRTKTRSGNTLHWASNQKNTIKQSQNIKQKQNNINVQNDDWLCKQLIQNQVYGLNDDDLY